jgi:signal transduction histidine kinase
MTLPVAGDAAESDLRALLDPRQLDVLRAERFLATGRLVLAALSLLGLWLDPDKTSQNAELAYAVAASYVVLALGGALSGWAAPALLLRWRRGTHVLDLLAFCAIIYFTNGATSPFFAYLVFSLIAAALRWQWRGVLVTAGGAVAAYSIICALSIPPGAGETVLLTVTVRIVYLAVFAILLGHLGSYHGGLRRELEELASWPAELPRERDALTRQLLERAAAVLEAPAAMLLLREPEEPWLMVARWRAQDFRCERLPLDAFGAMVAPELDEVSFAAAAPAAADTAALCLEGTALRRWRGAALDARLARELDDGPLLALRLAGRLAHGRLLATARRAFSSEKLLLGSLVARQIESQLDQFFVGLQEQRAAAAVERMRLARDLHDGIIQSLTGASLKLQALDKMVRERPVAAHGLIAEIDELLVTEQRELRWFLIEGHGGGDWLLRLRQLPERMARYWGIAVSMKTGVEMGHLPSALGHEIYRLVHEALVNAARHGHARNADAELRGADGGIHITVADDGEGFPFHGHYDAESLREAKLGPVSLKQRVAFLGGAVEIDSSAEGARVEIFLPVLAETMSGGPRR